MSALPPKADIRKVVEKCPLMTQSGHWRLAEKTETHLHTLPRRLLAS